MRALLACSGAFACDLVQLVSKITLSPSLSQPTRSTQLNSTCARSLTFASFVLLVVCTVQMCKRNPYHWAKKCCNFARDTCCVGHLLLLSLLLVSACCLASFLISALLCSASDNACCLLPVACRPARSLARSCERVRAPVSTTTKHNTTQHKRASERPASLRAAHCACAGPHSRSDTALTARVVGCRAH